MISYAQNAEDVVLDRCFRGEAPGFYVDVGAASATEASVTRHFYERGWHGINIEPLPDWVAELRSDRPRDRTIQAAAGETPGRTLFYRVREDAALSTMRKEIAERHAHDSYSIEELVVKVVTLNEVLEEAAPGHIEFLKVDVEGAEAEVLAGLDLERWRPRVLLVESTEPNRLTSTWETFEPLILAHRYRYCSTDGVNRYYVREEDSILAPLLVPANATDDFTPLRERLLNDEIDRLRVYARHLEEALAAPKAPVSADEQPFTLERGSAPTRFVDLDRLAVVGSPQCGVALVAAAISDALGIDCYDAEHPADINWDALSDRAVISLVWPYSDRLRAKIAANGFRLVVVARHPLDVLLSVLRRSQVDRGTARWLDAADGPEAILDGLDPTSPDFLTWARSERAAALLEVSADWWQEPGAIRIRFEDFLATPGTVLDNVLDEIGATHLLHAEDDPVGQRGRTALGLEELGGGWGSFLDAPAVRALQHAHEEVFNRLGYPLPPAENQAASARVRDEWRRLGGETASS